MTPMDAFTDPLAQGRHLLEQGQVSAAVTEWRCVAEQHPDNLVAWACLLYAMSLDPHCAPMTYLREAMLHGERLVERAQRSVLPPFNRWHLPYAPADDAPLRVGLVSGNFHAHPVGYFLEQVLKAAPPQRIQWFVYANRDHHDGLTHRLKATATHWTPIAHLDDPDVALTIHAHGLHVLIDLDGHTDGNRLPVFAWQAAPLQVSWLGHWASTGLSTMDAVLADALSLSTPSQAQFFCEAIEHLPDTRLCFSAPEGAPDVSDLPAMRKGHITFASFQSPAKFHPGVWRLWAQVMDRVPGSRLRLASRQPITDQGVARLTQQLQAVGLSPSRVDLAHPCERGEYLAAYAEVDMVLDTFPATGGTTTCEALWMGVPTLTLCPASPQGQPMMGRQGASLLRAAGLNAWIAHDEADFVHRAVAQSTDLSGLAHLRQSLRAQVQHSPLMDAPRFAAALDLALRRAWERKWQPSGAQ